MKLWVLIFALKNGIIHLFFIEREEFTMRKIGVILAMQKELDLYVKHMDDYHIVTFFRHPFYVCKYKGFDLIIAVSGIGKVAAALTASNMIYSFSPDLIINIGVSGGLDRSLKVGDWVLGTDLRYHDFWSGDELCDNNDPMVPHVYHSDFSIAGRQKGCVKGLLCCGDQFIVDKDELAAIKEQYPEALAVDMESAAIAQTCEAYNVKFLCMRQISDTPSEDNQIEQYEQFWHDASEHSYQVFKSILDSL